MIGLVNSAACEKAMVSVLICQWQRLFTSDGRKLHKNKNAI